MARNIAGWEYVRDFGGGGITGWGAHYVGAALFAARLHEGPLPVEVVPDAEDDRPTRRRDAGDSRFHPWMPAGATSRSGLTWKYAGGVRMHLGNAWGGPVSFKGTLGRMPDPGMDRTVPRPVRVPNYGGGGGIQGDFLHCVRTRQRPFRDIAIANRAMAACHLANIALWTGRALKFDPVKEQIIGDDEAGRWLQRACREPWRV
jgi:hypothetical protein